jgi:hypothetical protein
MTRAHPGPGRLRCFGVVVLARIALRLLGFRRTVRIAQRLAGEAGRAAGATPVELARRVAGAAAFFPGRARCLEQAVALYVLLRRGGYAAALRIGVQPVPFQAHAWIELDGEPLFEGEATARFIAFPEAFA